MNKKICDSLIHCPEKRLLLFTKNGYPVMECKTCGHRFTEIKEAEIHLEEVYSEDYFYGGKDYPNYLDGKEVLIKTGGRYAKIVSRYTSPGDVLDVGSAAGFILKGFENAGWKGHGIEPNDAMADYGRYELQLDIRTGSLETYVALQKFDLVTLIQVIGHFYDLDLAIRNMSGLLNDKGLVLVESWNMKSLIARMMGKGWHEYNPPSVIHWFSTGTLKQLFEYYGFELIATGRPAKKINVRHAVTIVTRKLPKFISKKLVPGFIRRAVAKWQVPYPPVDLKWYLFRKK